MSGEALTSQEALVLAAMSDRARYGYEMVGRIEELTDCRVSLRPGNLYRVIDRLMARELVEEVAPPDQDRDERRRYFRATAAGRRAASAELSMYGRALERAQLGQA